MRQDSRTHDEEQLYSLVRQYDEALAHGAEPASLADSVSRLESEAAEELEHLYQCVALLEQLRRGRDSRLPQPESLGDPELVVRLGDLPQRIGRFELRGEIGRGGCGVVFRAYDSKLERDVAIKIPRPEALISEDMRQRFLREARAAGNLDHPNVVPIYEVGEDGPVCYIAAAYIEGPSLAAWLRRNKIRSTLGRPRRWLPRWPTPWSMRTPGG